jgi:hypothetical protein
VQLPPHFHTFPTPPRARREAPQVRRAAMFTGVPAFQMGSSTSSRESLRRRL